MSNGRPLFSMYIAHWLPGLLPHYAGAVELFIINVQDRKNQVPFSFRLTQTHSE